MTRWSIALTITMLGCDPPRSTASPPIVDRPAHTTTADSPAGKIATAEPALASKRTVCGEPSIVAIPESTGVLDYDLSDRYLAWTSPSGVYVLELKAPYQEPRRIWPTAGPTRIVIHDPFVSWLDPSSRTRAFELQTETVTDFGGGTTGGHVIAAHADTLFVYRRRRGGGLWSRRIHNGAIWLTHPHPYGRVGELRVSDVNIYYDVTLPSGSRTLYHALTTRRQDEQVPVPVDSLDPQGNGRDWDVGPRGIVLVDGGAGQLRHIDSTTGTTSAVAISTGYREICFCSRDVCMLDPDRGSIARYSLESSVTDSLEVVSLATGAAHLECSAGFLAWSEITPSHETQRRLCLAKLPRRAGDAASP